MNLTRLLRRLSAPTQTTLQAKRQVRYLQRIQINALKFPGTYQAKLPLDKKTQNGLFWLIKNPTLCNGWFLNLPSPDLLLRTGASTKGWWTSCQGFSTNRSWSTVGQKHYICVLELKEVKLGLLTYKKFK